MLVIDRKICLSCAGCITLCPDLALYHNCESLQVNQTLCTDCTICVRFCPVLALTIDKSPRDLRVGRR